MATRGPRKGTVNNPKGVNQYNSSGPKQRSIVGASRVLTAAANERKKSQTLATGRALSNADTKFVNYRIQSSGSKAKPMGVSSGALDIYKRMKKIKQ